MRERPLGQSGIEASAVGFGAWAIGGWMWGGTSEAESIQAIHAAIDAGIDLIDTAPMYGFGTSESILGKAIRDRRDKVVLATKCGLVCNTRSGEFKFNSDAMGPNPDGHVGVFVLLTPESIRTELEASLKRLQTDHVDLYQTHWQDSTTPIAETMGALMDLKREGKIRAIGVSNASSAQMDEYRKIGPVDSDQEKYSMLDRAIEADQLPYCDKNGIAVLAYSPLAQGLLTGKVGPDRKFADGDQRLRNPRFSVESRRRIAKMLEAFKPIAKAHDVTLSQLTIAWTLAQPGLTHALCGARTPAQARENARAGDVELTADELRTIAAAVEACAAQT
ncbi:MAG: aldo/keto reductase [Phycisphaerae bacterium]|nr:aldo/keto reductase [Phycisphaerae bacterium]